MKQIRSLPAAPLSTDSQNVFNNKAFALVDALDDFVLDTNEVSAELNLLSQNVSSNASSAADSKTQAQNFSMSAKQSSDQAASYFTSFMNSPITQATSNSGITIGLGVINLTITQTGKNFVPGQFVQIVNSADKWMLGAITSFNASTGAMVVNVAKSKGNGETFNAWTITPSNPVQLEDCVVAMTVSYDSSVPVMPIYSGNYKNVYAITSLGIGSYLLNLREPCPLNTVLLASFTTAPVPFTPTTSTPDITASGGNVQIEFFGAFRNSILMRFYSGAGNFFTPANFHLMAFSF